VDRYHRSRVSDARCVSSPRGRALIVRHLAILDRRTLFFSARESRRSVSRYIIRDVLAAGFLVSKSTYIILRFKQKIPRPLQAPVVFTHDILFLYITYDVHLSVL